MSDGPPNASIGFTPKWKIPFPTFHATLARPFNPILFDDTDGLVIFGDSSAIYFALVSTGSGVYSKLPTIKATTYIHGWALDAGNLYVLDGVELTMWSLGDATKRHTVQLLTDPDATTARVALVDLKKAIQAAEWAAFLEQAEDEHDRLTTPTADFVHMLEALRAMVGSANTSTAARQKIAELRTKLAEKRKAAAPWCFSTPLVRPGSLEEPTTAVFVMQGNGMLYACDKELGPPRKNNWDNTQADLHLALLGERTSPIKRLAFVADSTFHVVDPVGLTPKGHWSPVPVPEKGTTHSLIAGNGQFWWSTDAGVYALKPDDTTLQLTWQTGPAWNARQVGRVAVPQTNYNPPPDPNELFESMNVHGWIDQRTDKTAPLSDGMAAQLLLSDENGKYVAPPAGTSHVLYSPGGGGAARTWGEVRPHHSFPLVLLSDSNTANMLCKYPSPCGLIQLLPQWVVAPCLSSVVRDSPADVALSQPWPAPDVRPLSKPQPNMWRYLHSSAASMALVAFELQVSDITHPSRNIGDRELRYVFWWAIFDHPFPDPDLRLTLDHAKKALMVFYTDAQVQALRTQFAGLGTVWDYWGLNQAHVDNFDAAKPPPDFDPPWVWKTHPPSTLFHKPPPRWYDPWGYNRPGDFISQQPAATYLDPFCFNGQMKFPQRPITFSEFKGHQWAVFVDNNPAGEASALEEGSADEPGILIIRTDEDHKLTTFYMLSSKHLGVTYNATTHELHHEAQPYDSTTDQVLGAPGIFANAAWWAGSLEYPSVRLQKTAAPDPAKGGVKPWDTFVNANKARYGPTDGGTAWNIAECPLPSEVLPSIVLFGHFLPAPH